MCWPLAAGRWPLAAGRVPKLLPIFMLSSVLVFSSSCSAPKAVSQSQFTAMPSPGGQGEEANYVTILGPITGTGSKTFTIVAGTGIAAWLGCIGKGLVWFRSLAGSFAADCDDGGTWVGSQIQPTHCEPGRKSRCASSLHRLVDGNSGLTVRRTPHSRLRRLTRRAPAGRTSRRGVRRGRASGAA